MDDTESGIRGGPLSELDKHESGGGRPGNVTCAADRLFLHPAGALTASRRSTDEDGVQLEVDLSASACAVCWLARRST